MGGSFVTCYKRKIIQCDSHKQRLCHTAALPLKKYLKSKEELWKLKYFTMQKYINILKILQKKSKSFKIL